MKELIDYRWQQYLNEKGSTEPEEVLRSYIARFVLTIEKGKINRQDAINFIRIIPNVTTVKKEAETSTSDTSFKALFAIKFAIEPWENLNTYIVRVLKKDLENIPGVKVNAYKGVEKLD